MTDQQCASCEAYRQRIEALERQVAYLTDLLQGAKGTRDAALKLAGDMAELASRRAREIERLERRQQLRATLDRYLGGPEEAEPPEAGIGGVSANVSQAC